MPFPKQKAMSVRVGGEEQRERGFSSISSKMDQAGIHPSEWEETLRLDDVFPADSDTNDWYITKDNYMEILRFLDLDTEDIIREVQIQLQRAGGQ